SDPSPRTATEPLPPQGAGRDTPDDPAPPARRPDLLLRPLGDRGRYVVKDPRTGAYFTVGEQEHFLLCQLDGRRSAAAICAAFAERLGEPLAAEELAGFIQLARSRGLLEAAERVPPPAVPAGAPPAPSPQAPPPARPRQSLLFWRKSLFDPDR